MSGKCRKSDSDSGVYVETYSGVSGSDVCSLGGRNDVKHVVTIKNLLLYDAEVSCDGFIHADPRQVEFLCTQFAITPGHWSRTASDLPQSEQLTFDQVYLKGVGSGSEFVRAEIEIKWPEPNQQSKFSLPITVNV
jgi:hypothetical protein